MEINTTNYIMEQLHGLPGVRILTGQDQLGINTGVLAIIGDESKPIVGLRADIDALPLEEKTDLPYQSTHFGVMHACGHDGHTAMLLGAVHILSNLYESGKLKGTVKCLFQPAEETEDSLGKTGAQYILESGVLSDVESMIALHLDPELPLKEVRLKPGVVMANVDTFSLTIRGTGGHGAYPEQTVDPIWLTSMILPYLYSLPSRKLSAMDPSVLSICQITGGASTNVIPSSVILKGTMRTYSKQAREQLLYECKKGLKMISELGGTYDLYLHQGEPALFNDPDLAHLVESVLSKIDSTIVIHHETYGMGGEDFSHILNDIPGVMMFIGAKEKKTSLHQPTFTFDERALEFGMNILVQGALDMINTQEGS
jgi:amidohydrolase